MFDYIQTSAGKWLHTYFSLNFLTFSYGMLKNELQ